MLYVFPRVYKGEEGIKLPYNTMKMIILNPMASVLTPLKGANKQDWHLYNDSKA